MCFAFFCLFVVLYHFLFNFCGYTLITEFLPFAFSLSKPPHIPIRRHFQILGHFFFVHCYCMHIRTLYLCRYSQIQTVQPIWFYLYIVFGPNHLVLHSQLVCSRLFSVAYSSLCKVKSFWDFPCPLLCLFVSSLFISNLGVCVGKTSCCFSLLEQTQITSINLSNVSDYSFCHLHYSSKSMHWVYLCPVLHCIRLFF